MTPVLFLWLFVVVSLADVDGKTNERRIKHIRRSNVEAAHHSNLKSGGPFCQDVVAYYEGTFKNKQHPDLNYTAQFQIRLNASLTDQQIYVVFDHWNQTLLSNNPFSFDFAYDNKDIIGSQIGASYSGPFGFSPSDFTLTLDHEAGQRWDNSIHIIYFSAFNNSFQLENSIEQCTRKQLEMTNVWNMDPDLVDYCVCCGEYLPSEELGCPTNPWSRSGQPTTTPPRLTTPPSLVPVSCQSVVGYYSGTFKNKDHPDRIYSAEFQVRMTSDLNARQYQLTVEGWNQTVSKNTDFSMDFSYYNDDQWCEDLTVGKSCSASFGDEDSLFTLDLNRGNQTIWSNAFHLFGFDPFNDHTFTFDAIGKCTNTPPTYDNDYTPDPTLYSTCLCCDNYKPHPALNCPKSPWA